MEDLLAITLLYDFYGELLTEKQREIFLLYYQEDYSLSEISELLKVSRQAISNSLKRAKDLLEEFDGKLDLIQKQRKMSEIASDISDTLEVSKLEEIRKEEVLMLLNLLGDIYGV